QKSDKPVLIACKTIIGYGLPTRQGTQKAHSDAPGAEEIAGARKLLEWDSPPFVVPDDILADWRKIGSRGAAAHGEWKKRKSASPKGANFDSEMTLELPSDLAEGLVKLKKKSSEEKPSVATRKASEAAL